MAAGGGGLPAKRTDTMKPIVDCQRLQLGRGLMCPFAHSPHARPPPLHPSQLITALARYSSHGRIQVFAVVNTL